MKTILVTGVFDILHAEHEGFLQKAKSLGDRLIVGIESDERVKELKGQNRPINNEQLRIKNLKRLKITDEVFVLPENMGERQVQEDLIKKIRPDFLAVSSHTIHLEEKKEIVEKFGGKLVIVHEHNPEVSTTKVLNSKITLELVRNNYKESKKLFETAKLKLEKILKGFEVKIEHIGSTAVSGTIGKGIIDILLICKNGVDQIRIRDLILKSGYRQGELDKKPDGRLFFYLSDSSNFRGGIRVGDLHLHLICEDGNKNHFLSLKMRDYLRKNPSEVLAYNEEKNKLARRTSNDRRLYTSQKGEFIKSLLSRIESKIFNI